jgi:hypothetical protein
MRKFLGVLLAVLMLVPAIAFAEIQVENNSTNVGIVTKVNVIGANTTRSGETATIDLSAQTGDRVYTGTLTFQSNLVAVGVANGGTSHMVSLSTAVPLTYSVVQKYVGSTVGQAGTLANSKAGQILKIIAEDRVGSGTYILSPTTTTGYTSITFSAKGQFATLLYVSDSIGWIVIGYYGVTIA